MADGEMDMSGLARNTSFFLSRPVQRPVPTTTVHRDHTTPQYSPEQAQRCLRSRTLTIAVLTHLLVLGASMALRVLCQACSAVCLCACHSTPCSASDWLLPDILADLGAPHALLHLIVSQTEHVLHHSACWLLSSRLSWHRTADLISQAGAGLLRHVRSCLRKLAGAQSGRTRPRI